MVAAATEADKRFTEIFRVGNAKHSEVLAFRDVVRQGMAYAKVAVHKQWTEFARQIFTDPQYDSIFVDKEKAKAAEGGPEGLGKTFAESQLEKCQAAVDAASLVFSHSVLDALAMDYCRLTALVAPDRWERMVRNRTVALGEVKGTTYEKLTASKIQSVLDELSRESLLTKTNRLFQVCRPGPKFAGLNDYTFDRSRLEYLDNLRHKVIHSEAELKPIPKIDEEVWYLFQTVWFFMSMVNKAFGLRLDPMHMTTKPDEGR